MPFPEEVSFCLKSAEEMELEQVVEPRGSQSLHGGGPGTVAGDWRT